MQFVINILTIAFLIFTQNSAKFIVLQLIKVSNCNILNNY